MPEKKTIQRVREDARQGKGPGTQAGEFVREEIEHIREASMARAPPGKPLRSVFRKPGALV